MKAVIAGGGLSGITAAILLKKRGYDVEVFETRSHIGGNCHDSKMKGVMVHRYGPHGFHTNNEEVWNFLNCYTRFNNTCLEVKGNTSEGIIPLPYNLNSEKIIGKKTPSQIIDLIFRDYSEKMWGVEWEKLPGSITQRVPKIRKDFNSCYHLDKYQGIPEEGYTAMFQNMLEGIKIHLKCNSMEYQRHKYDLLIYTGKIDEFFNYHYGWLPYRSLKFKYHQQQHRPDIFQLNECNKKAWTRTIDHSHWHKDTLENNKTIISKEYPCEHNDTNIPFYPKPFGDNQKIYNKYKKIASFSKNVIFVGRLATYKYLDMDTAIAQVFQKLKKI